MAMQTVKYRQDKTKENFKKIKQCPDHSFFLKIVITLEAKEIMERW